ncbi:MAG: DUF1549 domain-containing protein [Planctomycetota bacterium]
MMNSFSIRMIRFIFAAIGLIAFVLNGVGVAWSADLDPRSSKPQRSSGSRSIDQLLRESWQAASIEPAARSGDAEFCRRVWLDLAGVAPPVWRLREFLEDSSPEKRIRLVDELLASPRFAHHMANRWTEMLLPNDVGIAERQSSVELNRWLREQFLSNQRYDHLVGGFLTAGGAEDRGPAVFYTSREADPIKLASATSRTFMGIQLECAQCHDHPFADWTQDDFWSFAAFYSQVELDQETGMRSQAVRDRRGKEITFPETEDVMAPRYPGVAEDPEPDPTNFRRRQLTIWLASRDNPYFARAAANRVWAHLFGRGLVDPVDEMDFDNPASHPRVLELLTEHLIESRFDLRSLYRMIACSDAYSLSSIYQHSQGASPQSEGMASESRPPAGSFAVMSVKTLSPAQFYDTVRQNVFLGGRKQNSSPAGGPEAFLGSPREQFLSRMGRGTGSPMEYPHGVVQSLGLMNGPEITQAVSPPSSGLIQALDAPFLADSDRVQTLFLACLSRYPTEAEGDRFLDFLSSTDPKSNREKQLSDMLWVLLNTSESFVCP